MRNAEKARERIRDAVLTNTQSFGTKNFYLGGGKKDKVKFTQERLKRTYTRLKEKGLCPDNLAGITERLILQGNPSAFIAIPDKGNYFIELHEEDWYDAVDTVVMRYAPELVDDETCKNYAVVIERHIQDLWVGMIIQSNARVREAENKKKKIEKSPDGCNDELLEVMKENAALQEQIQILKSRLEKVTENAQKLNSMLTQRNLEHGKEIIVAEAKKREEMDILQKKLDGMHAENLLLRGMLSSPENEEDNIEIEQEESVESELPESGVLFLGGHTNMVKKLRQIHPGWSYLGDENIPQLMTDRRVEVCVVWTKHLSHKVTRARNRNIKGHFPIVYVTSTNLELLEKEMRRGYGTFLRNANRQLFSY